MQKGQLGQQPEISELWKERYQQAIAITRKRGTWPEHLTALEQNVLLAWWAYPQRPDDPQEPPRNELARLLGCSSRAIRRAVAALRSHGVLP
jgi:hypothetical protein